MSASPIPADHLDSARERLIQQHGTERVATLRAFYTWLNLMMLLSFIWPAAVVVLSAPSVSVANTPADWFWLRLAAPLVVLVAAMRIWGASGVPGYVAHPARAGALAASGGFFTQVLLFLAGLTVVLGAILVLSDASAAGKVLVLGLCEALAIQVIVPGYVKSTLEVFEADPRRAFWICVALTGIIFALRGTLAAAIQPDAGAGLVVAGALGGVVAGVILGFLLVYLRDRTSTLLPGVILHWLIVAIVPAAIG